MLVPTLWSVERSYRSEVCRPGPNPLPGPERIREQGCGNRVGFHKRAAAQCNTPPAECNAGFRRLRPFTRVRPGGATAGEPAPPPRIGQWLDAPGGLGLFADGAGRKVAPPSAAMQQVVALLPSSEERHFSIEEILGIDGCLGVCNLVAIQ